LFHVNFRMGDLARVCKKEPTLHPLRRMEEPFVSFRQGVAGALGELGALGVPASWALFGWFGASSRLGKSTVNTLMATSPRKATTKKT